MLLRFSLALLGISFMTKHIFSSKQTLDYKIGNLLSEIDSYRKANFVFLTADLCLEVFRFNSNM